MFTVYVLRSLVAKKSYVGFTNNLEKRLAEHNSGMGFYTRRYIPWEVVYTETFNNIYDAKKREKYLKSRNGRRFLKKVFMKII